MYKVPGAHGIKTVMHMLCPESSVFLPVPFQGHYMLYRINGMAENPDGDNEVWSEDRTGPRTLGKLVAELGIV